MSSQSVQLATASLDELSTGAARRGLELVLAESISINRWFGGKARKLKSVSLTDVVPLAAKHCLVLVTVEYLDGGSEEYLVPLSLATGAAAEKIRGGPAQVIAAVQLAGSSAPAMLYDSLTDEQAAGRFLELVRDERQLAGTQGQIVCRRTNRFDELCGLAGAPLKTTILKSEQSNSSVVFENRLILKLFRRPERGINPEVEVTTFLTECAGFRNVPPVAGTIEYRREGEPNRSLAVVQGFVPNKGVAWEYTLDQLNRYFAGMLSQSDATNTVAPSSASLLALADRSVPAAVGQQIGSFLGDAELLGKRTAELHLALAGETTDNDFRPEPHTASFQSEVSAAACNSAEQTFRLLHDRLSQLKPEVQRSARQLLGTTAAILDRLGATGIRNITGRRIRVHGDYHLGQVLYTGTDFVIIDFEGEPIRPLAQRRIKCSPLRDVAGMLRSFDYAANSALAAIKATQTSVDAPMLEQWARNWNAWTSASFLRSYLRTTAGSGLLPESTSELQLLLDSLVLEKAVYELQYELNNRPDWVPIPLAAILAIADQPLAN